MMRAYRRATSTTEVTPQAEDDYYSFFMWCFHLKDWLKNDPSIPATTSKAAEELVNTDLALKLCADIANGVKHLRADRSARVDADSRLHALGAFQPDAFQYNAFDERIVIVASGGYFDARRIADACVSAWAEFLHTHGLTQEEER
jgi:hypothetical protein